MLLRAGRDPTKGQLSHVLLETDDLGPLWHSGLRAQSGLCWLTNSSPYAWSSQPPGPREPWGLTVSLEAQAWLWLSVKEEAREELRAHPFQELSEKVLVAPSLRASWVSPPPRKRFGPCRPRGPGSPEQLIMQPFIPAGNIIEDRLVAGKLFKMQVLANG